MDGVRVLAAIFFGLGWVMLFVALLFGSGLLLIALLALGRSGGAGGLFASLTTVATLAVASLSPFFCWAVLETLLEIHAAQQDVLRATYRLVHVAGAAPLGNAAPTLIPARALPSPPRTMAVTAPDRSPNTIECPNCGRPNATWRSVCADCQATLA